MKIVVKELCKYYRGREVLEQISIIVLEGQCLGLIGHNGSGKSVLLKAICGFISINKGIITVDGEEIKHGINFIKDAGVIIEQPDFIPYLSGIENLQLLADIKKIIGTKTIQTHLELVGLGETGKKKYKNYSLGMKQRLRIAQSLMEDPEILILDEPFNGLDKQGVKDIMKVLLASKAKGKTMIVTSHEQRHIEILADEILELEEGRLI